MRYNFYKNGKKSLFGQQITTEEAFMNTLDQPLNAPQAFLGGVYYNAVNNGDGTVTFTVYNQTDMHSFFYHLIWGSLGSPTRGGKVPLMGNIIENICWTEKFAPPPPQPSVPMVNPYQGPE